MEAEKSYSLPSARQRPGRASGIIPVWIQRPQNQGSWWCKALPRAGEDRCPSAAGRQEDRGALFLPLPFAPFWLPADWMRPTHTGRAIYLTDSVDPRANFIRNTLTDRPSSNIYSGHTMSLSSWLKINHCTVQNMKMKYSEIPRYTEVKKIYLRPTLH